MYGSKPVTACSRFYRARSFSALTSALARSSLSPHIKYLIDEMSDALLLMLVCGIMHNSMMF